MLEHEPECRQSLLFCLELTIILTVNFLFFCVKIFFTFYFQLFTCSLLRYALGIDNDEWCYENALENIDQNHVLGKVDFRLTEIGNIAEHDFDLLLTNIQKDVLLLIAKDISTKVKEGGIFILSGLLYTDETDIVECYTKLGLAFTDKMQLDEWISLVFKKLS